MQKDFDGWNSRKKDINEQQKSILFHEREVWWCRLGLNVGFEEDGKGPLFQRPILILKKFNNDILWAVPLTMTEKNLPYYHKMRESKDSAVLSQLRLISSRRLYRKTRKIGTEEFGEIVSKIKNLFPLI